MTVGELIAKLQMYDVNTPIFVIRDGKMETLIESDVNFEYGMVVIE